MKKKYFKNELSIFLLLFTTLNVSSQIANTLNNMPADSWYELPNSSMEPVLYPSVYGDGIYGVSGSPSVTNAWGGACYDAINHRLFVWGGGHKDYSGNEVYVFHTDTFTWERKTDPSLPAIDGGILDHDPLSDGNPVSRHTYGGLVYLENSNKIFAQGGSMCSSGNGTNETWAFDFTSNTWEHKLQLGTPPNPNSTIALACSYDPTSQNVFMSDNLNIRKYNYNTSTWSLLTALPSTEAWGEKAAVIVPNKNMFFILSSAIFYAYDIANNSFQDWTLPAAQATAMGKCTGLEYDPKAEQLLALDNLGIWSLDLNTKIWTAKNKTGIPSNLGADGPFGRWRYLPEYNVFMLVSSAKKMCYSIKTLLVQVLDYCLKRIFRILILLKSQFFQLLVVMKLLSVINKIYQYRK